MSSFWTDVWNNVTANVVASSLVNSTTLTVLLILGLLVWAWLRRRRASVLRVESERLIDAANHAIHHFLNTVDPQFVRHFTVWDTETLKALEALRRRRVCDAWHVDHFAVLGATQPANGANNNPQVNGQIVEKAKRLKAIAKELMSEADRLWPMLF
jgi:hypothetical protein